MWCLGKSLEPSAEEAFGITSSPEEAPDSPEFIDIEFSCGVPISLNGEKMKVADLIQKLNEIAGKHGVGRIDHVENRLVGINQERFMSAQVL